MPVAPLVAGWKLGHRNTSAPNMGTVDPVPTPTFPTTHLAFQVQIALDADPNADPATWNWTDITRFVFFTPGINITRGRLDEQTQAPPSRCTLTLRNFDPADSSLDGLFSPRNPMGPYYGRFGRNTPLRVDVDPGTGWNRRFTGFVSNWPPQWDITGRVKLVQIQAEGILRRLGQASSPLRSAAVRSISGSPDVVAYWPFEDGSDATQFSSYFADNPALTVGTITKAADSTAGGSLPLPTFAGDAGASAQYTPTVTSTQWRASAVFVIPTAPALAVHLLDIRTTGTVQNWRLSFVPGVSSATISLDGYSSAGALLVTSASVAGANNASVYGHPFALRLAAIPSVTTPGGVDWGVGLAYVNSGALSGSSSGGTLAAASVGDVTAVTKAADPNLPLSTFGHPAIFANGTYTTAVAAAITRPDGLIDDCGITGYVNELPLVRFRRLCSEQGITRTFLGGTSLNAMGAQPIAALLDILRETETVENGVLAETRNGVLSLYCRSAFENQVAGLTIDYDLQQVAPPFAPAEDDQRTRNDVTASRPSGSSARSFDKTGPLGTDAVGRYDDAVTTNVFTDDLLIQQASYRVVHGTVDEARYPQITINLARNPSLITAWMACDITARINVLNTPIDDGPGVVDQVLQGYTEHLDPLMWTAQLNCTPFSPHRIFRLASATADADDFLGYLIPTTCVLAEDLDTTETGVDVTSDTLWSTDPDDWSPPVKVSVGGEDMLVSAVTGGANPQTLTVTRSVNGIVKTHTTGDSLGFATPGVMGL